MNPGFLRTCASADRLIRDAGSIAFGCDVYLGSGWKTSVVHHFDLVPRLTDGVVVLDAHGPDDVKPQVAGEDEETARRFGWWPERSDTTTVERAFQDWSNDWVLGRGRRAFAVRTAEGRLVGGCELRLQPDGATAQVSYWTNTADRGCGYGSRALALLVDYATSAGIVRLESHVAADNVASCRVSERAGFVREGSFYGEDGEQMIRYGRSLCSA